MPTLIDRITAAGRDFVRRVNGDGTSTTSPQAVSSLSAWTNYDLRDMLLSGDIYRLSAEGGALRDVLKSLGRPSRSQDEAKYAIRGYYNPVRAIVEFYSNAFGGQLGTDLQVADEVNGRKVFPRMADVVRQVWRWSNLDNRLGEYTGLGANQGTVGVRIVSRGGDDPRVYLDFDDPRFITSAILDHRGNCETVFLEYSTPVFDADGSETGSEKVEEVISKYGFSQKVGGVERLSTAEQRNDLGLCPYVIVRHQTAPGEVFGRHAYYGTEPLIHGINFGLSQLDASVVAHVWPYIFATAPARKPEKFTTDRYTLIYSQTREGQPQPTFDPMVPDLDFSGSIDHLKNLCDMVRDRQPQTILNSLTLLSGISGETLAEIKAPAKAESRRARTVYEDGAIRAIQIAASWGVFLGVPGFDLGTGTGTKEAADRAFDDGDGPEAFAFKDRPELPPTVFEKIQQASADVAERKEKFALAAAASRIVSDRKELLMLGGYDEKRAEELATVQTPAQPGQPGQPPGNGNGGGVSARIAGILGLS